MVDMEIVTNKVASIEKHVKRIKRHSSNLDMFLKDQDAQDIIIHNLQHAIQACISLGSHIIADDNLGIANSVREVFQVLEKEKIIDSSLANSLMKMGGFRNILIHEYEELDLTTVKSIVENNLSDLIEFCRQIVKYTKNS